MAYGYGCFGYGMMSGGYGYGWMVFSSLIAILIFVGLVLFIVWIFKRIQNEEGKITETYKNRRRR